MKLDIRSHHLTLHADDHQAIRKRIFQAFGRVSPWIANVQITLSDVNGPKGGADKRCRLHVRLRSMMGVVVEEVGVDVLEAVASASRRAEQTILRKIARHRTFAPMLAS